MQKTTCALAVLMALASVGAAAQEVGSVTVSGFGTAALTWSDTDQAEFARPNQLNGVKKDARSGVDSNLGVQATFIAAPSISFTGQVIGRKYATDTYGAELAWAFAKYRINEAVSVRLGRVGAPVYMISDFRNVGYANTMIRPSVEVYRQVNMDSLDGADLIWQTGVGEGSLSSQIGLGSSSVPNAGGSTVKYHRVYFLNLVYENGPYTLRFGRAQGNLSQINVPAVDSLKGALRASGFGSVADRMSLNHVDGSFTSVGAIADYGQWFAQGEYARRRVQTLAAPDTSSWYVLGGYRLGKFTPYLHHGKVTQDSPRSISGMPSSGPAAALTAGVNSVIRVAQQSTTSLGLRWDFYKSAALKVQVDHISPNDGAGAFLKPAAGFTGPAKVYAVGVDYVF
ncbi:porin [Massilia sp. TS11]|uniref:porin n=1 Tax=Massilia sp. TS11 TaxID=2908003 RepID=UPI001EDAE05C|nr:porin [Massilia sp. TS11]MCG2584520.1 porin [Massilia sp. TS11]